jgi:hypothetical protein
MRVGFYKEGEAYIPNVLLSAVEPPAADILELRKLSAFSGTVVYHASRNRQCHTYAVTERRDARSQALRRVFSRCVLESSSSAYVFLWAYSMPVPREGGTRYEVSSLFLGRGPKLNGPKP